MNDTLNRAKKAKNNEFYTRLEDIKAEILRHHEYRKFFKGKTVYCNCDNPHASTFWLFFILYFDLLGIKKVIATHFRQGGTSYKIEWQGQRDEFGKTVGKKITKLSGDGDFRSPECLKILDEADIVVTNPPFSLLREFVEIMMDHNKDFLIIGNENFVSFKNIFPLFIEKKIRSGYGKPKIFDEPGGREKKLGFTRWFTTLAIEKENNPIVLTKHYYGNEDEYPMYENFNAINVKKLKDIPCDYDGLMGVPITSIFEFNTTQFLIIGEANHGTDNKYDIFKPSLKEKDPCRRLIIKNLEICDSSTNFAGPIIKNGKETKHPERFYLDGKKKYDKLIIQLKEGADKTQVKENE